MKARQRFTMIALSLSCILCAGTTFALISLEPPTVEEVAHDSRASVELLPTLTDLEEPLQVPQPDLLEVPSPEPVVRASRFDFMHPDADVMELPDEVEVAAVNPDSWSVEVSEQPVTAPHARRAPAKARTKQAKKRRKKRYTLKERLAEISPTAVPRLVAKFQSSKVAWPPAEVAFVALKDEKAIELYARPKDGTWSHVHRYKVLAASGGRGPKLKRGDKQVPEGVYRISYLNPNSAFHVSLRVNYPNRFDRSMARKDGRKDLGGDIMIHGKAVSAGCLAIGDPAAEELFVLAAEVGIRNVKVVIAPTDFRREEAISVTKGPKWVPKLYTEIASAMSPYKAPEEPSLLTLLGL
ncbi:MAG: L,D-transpeptidase family protein [Filomicrobium sp.]